MRERRVIAIISGKGGVGKSTTCLALAAYAARRGRRTVLIDLDPSGSATYAAGLEPSTIPSSLADVMHARVPAEIALQHVTDGFEMLAATPALVSEESMAAKTFPRVIAGLTTAEVILIDTPPGFGPFVRAAAAAASSIVIPIVAEPLAIRTAANVLTMLDTLGVPRKRIAGFLPTMHESRRALARDQLDALADLGIPVLAPIPRAVAAAEAALAGVAVTSYAPRSTVAAAYEHLARFLQI